MESNHTHKRTRAVMNRLSRISGHVMSIRSMVEEGRDCTEVLAQISAVRSAINGVGRVVLEDHFESCLFQGQPNLEQEEAIAEIKEAMDIFL